MRRVARSEVNANLQPDEREKERQRAELRLSCRREESKQALGRIREVLQRYSLESLCEIGSGTLATFEPGAGGKP